MVSIRKIVLILVWRVEWGGVGCGLLIFDVEGLVRKALVVWVR